MTNPKRVILRPIGYVKTKATEEDFKVHRSKIVSLILIDKTYSRGLRGIEEYSHLFIIFWLHKVKDSERRELLTYPKHRVDLPKVGVFSTRHRNHPNPIGLTVVQLLNVRSNTLKVKGLDAVDGTPVLDIKPYDYYDIYGKVRVPNWWLETAGKTHSLTIARKIPK